MHLIKPDYTVYESLTKSLCRVSFGGGGGGGESPPPSPPLPESRPPLGNSVNLIIFLFKGVSSCHLRTTTESKNTPETISEGINSIFWGSMPPDPPSRRAITHTHFAPPPPHFFHKYYFAPPLNETLLCTTITYHKIVSNTATKKKNIEMIKYLYYKYTQMNIRIPFF